MRAKYYDLEKHTAEEHFGVSARFREFVLGWQDGVVNVLGIVLGVAASTNDARLVLIAGLAATFAESISMAAVAYTSTKAYSDYLKSQIEKESREIDARPGKEKKEVYEIYFRKGFRGRLLKQIVNKITSSKKNFLEFMVREELKFEDSDSNKAAKDALLVGVSSFAGSLIPLVPFVFLQAGPGIAASVVVSVASLFTVGVVKAKMTVGSPLREGLETALVGGLAAIAGYAVGLLLGAILV